MKTILQTTLCLFLCLFIYKDVSSQAPVFNSATPNSNTIGRYEKFEVNLSLTAGYTNAYDYDDIAVQAIFTSPSGRKDTVDGFFMQDYTASANGNLTAVGSGSFKIRYSPNETGSWSYTISCKNTLGSADMPAQTFTCQSSTASGLIRKNTTNYLSFDDGNQYIPIGENMGWQSSNPITDYSNWVSKLSDNGGNFIRVWMSSWAFALEWKNGTSGYSGLKKYKQSSAYYLDWLLDYCKDKNMYMMLTLNNHGQVSTTTDPEWANNPYNAANGGPATNTWDFFTNATAKLTLKNRLRYLVARYGYSRNIQSWELFNELLWTDQAASRKTDLTAWDDEMSTYIKKIDVYKHLVTTSYGSPDFATNTWSLPNIDFSQTHFYVSTPAMESILASANQSYLSQFSKPTLNGEFGLGPSGATLSTDDPTGVHIHNTIWGSTFSGAMGSAMTWWWDSYIEPKGLYYHYKPLSSFVSGIDLKNGNYKKVTATSSGGGASDVMISPGAGFTKAAAGDFTIDASGSITPGAGSLSSYLFGSTYNTGNRNPPTFHVTYPIDGQFKVVTNGSMSSASPKITIYLDGVQLVNADAVINTTYTINVPAGAHNIKVDNLGIDWAGISNYVFTNVGAPITSYVLKSDNSLKASGYVLNNKYNWQYLKNNGGTAPPAINGSSVIVPTIQNGTYAVQLFSCSTGNVISQSNITVTNGSLTIPMPSIAWDIAFTAAELSTLPIKLASFTGQNQNGKNYLNMNIISSENVKTVYMQRSNDPAALANLKEISTGWPSIAGAHQFVDESPLAGANYYRLKIVDNDGRETFSNIVKLVNGKGKLSIYPNPVKDYILLTVDAGTYFIRIFGTDGKTIRTGTIVAGFADAQVKLSLSSLKKGVYYLSLSNDSGLVGTQKLIKQ